MTKKAPMEILQNGLLFLFLHSQFPSILPNSQIRMDLSQLRNKDILGTCLMQKTNTMVAYLKQQCLSNFNEDASDDWKQLLNQSQYTSAAYFMTYAKTEILSTQKRIIINAFITKQWSKEYDSEVKEATKKVSVLERDFWVGRWICFQCNRSINDQSFISHMDNLSGI